MGDFDVLRVPSAEEERHREVARRRLRRVIQIYIAVPFVGIGVGVLAAPSPLRWLFLAIFAVCAFIPFTAHCPTCGKNVFQRRRGAYRLWPDVGVCSKCGDRL